MSFTKSINILGKRYKVRVVKKHPDAGVLGTHDAEAAEIIVTAGEDAHATFLHEVLHAVFYRSGVRQTHSWSPDVEEILCEMLSNFFVEHPEIFRPRRRQKRRG